MTASNMQHLPDANNSGQLVNSSIGFIIMDLPQNTCQITIPSASLSKHSTLQSISFSSYSMPV